jgi:TRAP-type C4-dicarboxylate transport system permease small subunit
MLVHLFAALMTLCFAALILIVAYQVFSRMLESIPIWQPTEEIARGLLIWLVTLGAALGVRHHEHFSMELRSLQRPAIASKLHYLKLAVILTIAGIFVIFGWSFLVSGFRRHSLLTGWPAAWSYSSFFVSGCAMLYFTLQDIFRALTGRTGPDTAGG